MEDFAFEQAKRRARGKVMIERAVARTLAPLYVGLTLRVVRLDNLMSSCAPEALFAARNNSLA
jgi:hypothetical protein